MESNSSLDPLGPQFGKINAPAINTESMSPFEGDVLRDDKINFFQAIPKLSSVNPNYPIQDAITGHAPGIPSNKNNRKNVSASDVGDAIAKNFQMQVAANRDRNQYAKVNAYNAGPSGNSFYKRYAAYGQKKFDEIGFSPLRDNEAMFNANTTVGDDFSRMMKNSFVPLFSRGFVSGPKSLIKMMQGDFSADTEDARIYENAAAIGQSSKKGLGAFFSNTAMNFGYTAGIISEAILEEAAGALLAPLTGGGSFFAATANNARKIGKIGDAIGLATDGYKAINTTLKEANNIGAARNMWKAAENIGASKVGKFLNPLENTFDALTGIGKNADNLTGLARLAQGTNKTAGGLFRDIRNINMALAEARLEGGMTENAVYDKAYDAFYKKNNRAPSNDEQYQMTKIAKEAGMNTLMWNTALIMASNKVVIPNLLKSGVSKRAIQSKIDDVITMKGGKIVLEKTVEAGKKLAKGEFSFVEDSFKNSIKGLKTAPVKTIAKVSGRYLKANLMEGVQENLQDVISVANEKYYETAYKNKELGAHLYNKGLSSLRYEGLKNQFSSQGFETFASGALMGLFSGGLNLVKGGLDYGYNNTFNKTKYQEYKETREKHGKDVAAQLNALYKNPNEFFSSRVFNYGVQNNIISNIEDADTKEAKDELSEAFASQIHTALDTNTLEYFKDHISSFKELTPEEFEEAFGFEKGTGAKEQQKIDNILSNIDTVEKSYNYVKERFPNPINLSNYDENSPEYENAAILSNAWKVGVRDYVYSNHAFMNTTERMLKMSSSILDNPTMKKMSQLDMNLILNPSTIATEVNLLKTEIEGLKQNPEGKAELTKKQNRLKALEDFADAHEQHQSRPIKLKAAEQIFEAIKKDQGIDELTDEEKIEILNQTKDLFKKAHGEELTDEEIDHIVNISKGNNLLDARLETAYKNYLKNTNGIDPSYVFDNDIDNSFVILKDYYTLNNESKRLVETINLLHDPQGFMDHLNKNQEWMTNMYKNRESYFVDMVNKQMGALENNELLNKLADMNIFIDLDQFQDFMENGTPPKEFLDETTKQVIPIGSKKYKSLFFLLSQAKALKEKNISTESLEEKLQEQIEGLENNEKKELDALEKEEVKTITKTVKKEGLTIKDVALIISLNEYADLIDSKTGKTFTVFSSEDGLRSDDAEGDLISIKDIKTTFSEYTLYKLEQKADPKQVKAIEEKYNKLKEENISKFNAEKEKNKLELYSIHTPVDKLPKVLYKELQEAFNNSEEAQSVETDEFDEDVVNDMFASFILKNPVAKQIIDAYNNKSKEAVEKEKSGEGEEFTFKHKGADVNTSKYKTEQLVALSDQIKQLRDVETNPVTKEKYSVLANKFDKLVATRKSKKFSPAIQDTIKTLKEKLIAEQKNIAKRNDSVYVSKGVELERVTNFLQKFKEDTYTYKGATTIANAFLETLDKTGLTEDGIDTFINILNSKLPALNNSGYTYDTLDGVTSTADNLRNYLTDLLENKDILPNKSKQELLADIQGFISENAYEYTRKAGNYLDKELRAFFTPGKVPEFNESEISKEAFNELFGPDSFIKPLKAKIDSGELYVLADNIKVFDVESGVAGEIDLLLIDQAGKLQMIDFKTGDQKKWNGFQKDTRTDAGLNKIESYTLQQYAYARLLKKMTGLDTEINIMPLEVTINQKEYKIASVKQPSNEKLLGLDKWYFPLNPNFKNIKSKIDGAINIDVAAEPSIQVATAMNPELIKELTRLGYPEDVIKTLSKEDQKNIIYNDTKYAQYEQELDADLNALAFADEIAAIKGKKPTPKVETKEVSLSEKIEQLKEYFTKNTKPTPEWKYKPDLSGEGSMALMEQEEALLKLKADNIQAHGTAKGSIGEQFNDVLNILTKGLDPKRGGGALYTAPLAISKDLISVGAALGTSSGVAYRDGGFIILAKKGVNQIKSIDDIGGILVNQAVADTLPEIIIKLKESFPNLAIDSYSNAAKVVSKLNTPSNKTITQETTKINPVTVSEVENILKDITTGPALEEYLVSLRKALKNNQISMEDRQPIIDMVNLKKEEFKLANTQLSKTVLPKGTTVIVQEPILNDSGEVFADRGAEITVVKSNEKGVTFKYDKKENSVSLSKLDKHVTTILIQKAKEAQQAEEKLDEMDKQTIAESIKVVRDFIKNPDAIKNAEAATSEKTLVDIYEDLLKDLDC
jgi:hypothetical protein